MVLQVPGGHPCPSGRSRPGHSHHQLQCETLSDRQWIPHETQTVWGGCLHLGESQSQRCYYEGPGGCEVYFVLSCSDPFCPTHSYFITPCPDPWLLIPPCYPLIFHCCSSVLSYLIQHCLLLCPVLLVLFHLSIIISSVFQEIHLFAFLRLRHSYEYHFVILHPNWATSTFTGTIVAAWSATAD